MLNLNVTFRNRYKSGVNLKMISESKFYMQNIHFNIKSECLMLNLNV